MLRGGARTVLVGRKPGARGGGVHRACQPLLRDGAKNRERIRGNPHRALGVAVGGGLTGGGPQASPASGQGLGGALEWVALTTHHGQWQHWSGARGSFIQGRGQVSYLRGLPKQRSAEGEEMNYIAMFRL